MKRRTWTNRRLLRAAIHIARPLGLDPATTPIIDAPP